MRGECKITGKSAIPMGTFLNMVVDVVLSSVSYTKFHREELPKSIEFSIEKLLILLRWRRV